jgi:2'-5' RNA ligase
MIRLFVGLGLPPACRERLAALSHGLPGARWVPPENHHLTLAFVGEVAIDRAEALAEALAGIVHPAVEVRLSGLGLAGDAHRARTLWVEAARTPSLVALQARVQAWLSESGAAGCEPFLAEAFALYSSRLRPEGSVYAEEARFPLGEAGGDALPSA